MYSSNIVQLVVAKLDIGRFTDVNTAKGPWSLLSLLGSTKDDQTEPFTRIEEVKVPSVAQLNLSEIQRTVREAAAAITGEVLEGIFLP